MRLESVLISRYARSGISFGGSIFANIEEISSQLIQVYGSTRVNAIDEIKRIVGGRVRSRSDKCDGATKLFVMWSKQLDKLSRSKS